MFKIHSKELTNDSLHSNNNQHHNCPFCQCPNSHSRTLSPYSSNHHHNHPIYTQTNSSTSHHNHMTMTFAPHLNAFNNSAVFNCTFPLSPQKKSTSIVFRYLSPPKTRKFNSAQSKFNTKQFKNARFPFIGTHKTNQNSQQNVNIPKNYTFTNELTPQKPKILKLNKMKSLQRLKLSSENESQHMKMYNKSQEEGNRRSNDESNMKTPINLLKEQVRHVPTTNNNRQSTVRVLNKFYPSPQSNTVIPQSFQQNIKQQKGNTQNIYRLGLVSEGVHDRRIQSMVKEDYMVDLDQVQSDYYQKEVATSITDELQLNYDYYYPIQDSDRSISMHVQL